MVAKTPIVIEHQIQELTPVASGITKLVHFAGIRNVPEYKISFFIAGAFGKPLFRPFPPMNIAAVVRIKAYYPSGTKPLGNKVKVLLNRNIRLDIIRPVLVKTCLRSHYPGVRLIPFSYGRHIAV